MRPPPDAAERRLNRMWHVPLAGTLAAATAIALLTGELSPGQRLTVCALVVGFAMWHWVLVVRHPERWDRLSWPMFGYWAGAAGFLVALLGFDENFTVVLYGLFPLMFVTLGWWAVAPIVGLTVLVGLRLGDWNPSAGDWLSIAATAGIAMALGVFVQVLTMQSRQRRDALEALAATRAELAAAARRSGVLGERERLAREIHDTVAQGLTSIVTQLEAADEVFTGHPDDARQHLAVARRTARASLGEVRRSVYALRPDLLDGVPLAHAMDRACRTWSADTGLFAELRHTGTPTPLRPDTETTLLRTVQEALANIARHARASRITVTLSYLGDTVTLDVNDDGVGFDTIAVLRTGGGFGLTAMRERVAAVGGRLVVESAPGRGTTIAASVPA